MSSDAPGRRYLHGHHDAVLRSHRQRTVENSAAYLLGRLRPTDDVLDVGCGPGTITAGLAARVPEGSVTGIDTSPAVLEEARAAPAFADLTNLHLQVGDVYQLEFEDGCFDVVHAHQVLQHLADPVAALVELRRVCRPGGTVAARDGDYGAMFWYPQSEALSEWQSLYRSVARTAGGEPDAGRHVAAWARAAGFAEVAVTATAWCFATPDERRWWGGLWAERITRSRFAEQAVGAGLAGREDLERLAGGWRRWMADEDAMFVVPHGEILCTP